MKQPWTAGAALLVFILTAIAPFSCPDPGVSVDYFQVRFTGDMSDTRKFGIGVSSDDILIDSGYFTNNTTTGYFAAPAGTYNLYDANLFDPDWRELEQNRVFEREKEYEIHGYGLNGYTVTEIP